MNRPQYISKVKEALAAKMDILNIAGLERALDFPKNKIRKWLRNEHEPTADEAHKVAKLLNEIGFEFSGLNMSREQIRALKWR